MSVYSEDLPGKLRLAPGYIYDQYIASSSYPHDPWAMYLIRLEAKHPF